MDPGVGTAYKLLNIVQNVEVCDATDDDSSTKLVTKNIEIIRELMRGKEKPNQLRQLQTINSKLPTI